MEVSEARRLRQLEEENATEARRGRAVAGQRALQAVSQKVVGPQMQRQAVEEMRSEAGFGATRLRAGEVPSATAGIDAKGRRPAFAGRLRELAATRRRFGYRRLKILLKREGFAVNHKRVYRLYVGEAGAATEARTAEDADDRRTRAPKATGAPDEVGP